MDNDDRENEEEKQLDSAIRRYFDGRDEMNLAEFPLAFLGKRPDDETQLVFADRIYDKKNKAHVDRELAILPSKEYGLPKSADEEVIVGALQLTSEAGFTDREVFFTPYQFLRLMGWGTRQKDYERLEEALNRWASVTLKYKNAWWDKREGSWVSETFHIFDNVTFYSKERKQRERRRDPSSSKSGLSSFTWNKLVFRNFQAGNLKRLDFGFFRELNSPLSRRMYRFLDKRFYQRREIVFPLKTFACDHLGLSSRHRTFEIKRILSPAIEELARHGFIEALDEGAYFRRIRAGEWEIVLCKGEGQKKQQTPIVVPEEGETRGSVESSLPPSAQSLVAIGVDCAVARDLAIEHEALVLQWLAVYQSGYLKKKKDPIAYLVSVIKRNAALPKRYLQEQSLKQRQPQLFSEAKAASQKSDASQNEDLREMEAYLATLNEAEVAAFETAATAATSKTAADSYFRLKARKSSGFQALRDAILLNYFRLQRGRIDAGNAAEVDSAEIRLAKVSKDSSG